MPVLAINELANAAHLLHYLFQSRLLAFDAKLLPLESSVNRSFAEKFPTVRRQGSALPGALALRRSKELPQQAQPRWFVATNRPRQHLQFVRPTAQAHQRKPPSTQSSSSKAR